MQSRVLLASCRREGGGFEYGCCLGHPCSNQPARPLRAQQQRVPSPSGSGSRGTSTPLCVGRGAARPGAWRLRTRLKRKKSIRAALSSRRGGRKRKKKSGAGLMPSQRVRALLKWPVGAAGGAVGREGRWADGWLGGRTGGWVGPEH
jgi:hypothetical protein